MHSLNDLRAGKSSSYPDQTIYAEYACGALGLTFQEIDGGTGLIFNVSSPTKSIFFGAGRCSFFPQNNATAASLATDKYFANAILDRSSVANLGGQYFFLHDRHRAYRPPGHERADALAYFDSIGASAFAKPLTGSRGDFAQALQDGADLTRYMSEVSRYYDSILIQPVFSGQEYRIFVLDDEVIYSARKFSPFVLGDGVQTIRDLLLAQDATLQSRGISSALKDPDRVTSLNVVLPKGQRWEVPGRMNRSAGGTMRLEKPPAEQAAFDQARRATRALGLRAAAVDLFTDIGGDAEAVRVIEVNANPSIRSLEDCNRPDLILKIWQHTFSAMGLLVV